MQIRENKMLNKYFQKADKIPLEILDYKNPKLSIDNKFIDLLNRTGLDSIFIQTT